ncbi:uncharacterized protein LOC128557269 [Mercenaria mercenaria]|uniref:uncharacterized protein LOC128557269 n=1 Tax=Mercenaria mercenaria TaxID=6596 RepID=UPI00234F6B50|nr:uncharacterized protein LOC128557269 [Mercenaria mercenaria]
MSFFFLRYGTVLLGMVICFHENVGRSLSTSVPSSTTSNFTTLGHIYQSSKDNNATKRTSSSSAASSSSVDSITMTTTDGRNVMVNTNLTTNTAATPSPDSNSTRNKSRSSSANTTTDTSTSSSTIVKATSKSTTTVKPTTAHSKDNFTLTTPANKTTTNGSVIVGKQAYPYDGIEAVAGVSIVLISAIIILIVAFLARFERHREKVQPEKVHHKDEKTTYTRSRSEIGTRI